MFYDENKKVVYKAKNTGKRKKRKNRKKKKLTPWQIALIVASAVLALILAVVGTLFLIFRYNRDDSLNDLTDSELGITVDLPKTVTNIALFGIDSRSVDGTTGNTDSIMIISIDSINNKVRLISVMRDTLVKVDGYSICKINSLYAKGGPQLAIKSLNQLFGLDIRHYATINFDGMAKVIDAMGGIEVELTEAERQRANMHMKALAAAQGFKPDYIEKSGLQVLNGMQAVQYARLRKVATLDGVNDDFGRTDRQRYVMEQLFNKAISMEKTKYPATIKALLPYMETSMGYSEIFTLATILMGDVSFEQSRVPLQEYVIDADYTAAGVGSSVYYNFDFARKVIYAFFYEGVHPEDYIENNPIDKTRWHTPASSSTRPQTNTTSTPVVSNTPGKPSSEPQESSKPTLSSEAESSDLSSSSKRTETSSTGSSKVSSTSTSSKPESTVTTSISTTTSEAA